jgi:hypothetical protein
MKRFILKTTTFSLFFIFMVMFTFSQELKEASSHLRYIDKITSEGYQIVERRNLSKGELPESFPLSVKAGHRYIICLVPKGKLKELDVWIGFDFTFGSTKDNPVLYGEFNAYKSKTYKTEISSKKRNRKFKLSSANSVYYILAAKPF